MALARKLYEQLDAAADDPARFRLIADAIGQLEEGWPRPGEIARGGDVRGAELRQEAQLAEVRKEIKDLALRLQGEIELVRKEIKEVGLRLQREIVQSRNDLLKWMVPLMFAQVVAIATLVKLL